MRFAINRPKVAFEVFDHEAVVLNLDSGNYYSVNRGGVEILRWIEAGASVEEILGSLEPGASVRGDVSEFVDLLRREGILRDREEALRAEPPSGDRIPYEPPKIEKFSDLQDLLLLDPIHDVDAAGWPRTAPNPPPPVADR
jgi:hypothetical protein